MLLDHNTPRSSKLNYQLAWSMAFVAGAVNAGGFLAVAKYTSHVTGTVSTLADELALGHVDSAIGAALMLAAFVFGSFVSTFFIIFYRTRHLESRYAIPLFFEALWLLVFGYLGSTLTMGHDLPGFYLPITVLLLCFIMGIHNSIVTKISHAEVRTTHMTGIATDIGIELSKLFYARYGHALHLDPQMKNEEVMANTRKLKLHSVILLAFLVGGLGGAWAFKHIGYKMTVPLALFLCFLALHPIWLDLEKRFFRSHK